VICLTGVGSSHKSPFDIGLFNRDMVLNNGTVFGSVNANRDHYAKAADVLAKADHAWLSRLITRRVPLANFADALKKQKGDIKVVIDFSL
jgi:threonine dehydrogenase-like Zn-dependent dehydrogenase